MSNGKILYTRAFMSKVNIFVKTNKNTPTFLYYLPNNKYF